MKPFHEELKALRIEKGVSLENIYNATKIRPSILEKLEEGDFTIAPEPFLHAFLREYAEVAGIDPVRVIARYENRIESIDEDVPAEEKKQEIILPADKPREEKPEAAPITVKEPETRTEPSASLPVQKKFIEDENTETLSDNLKEEEDKEQVSVSYKSSLTFEEPRSSQGLLLGIFIVVIIIAALVIMYVTGGIHL